MEIGDKVVLKCRVYGITRTKDHYTLRLTTEQRWDDTLGVGGRFIDVDITDVEVLSAAKV